MQFEIPSSRLLAWSLSLVAVASAISGCSSPRALMPTPAIYARGVEQAFSDRLPNELKSPSMPVLFATDRAPESGEAGSMTYGIGRSRSLALGEAVVNIGGDASWEDLVADASTDSRPDPLKMRVQSVVEKVRTPEYPLRYSEKHGRTRTDPGALAEENRAQAAARRLLKQRLSLAPRKEVLIYVHGVATSFERSLYTTAEIWHFMGREFVPIAYSWPAGRKSLVRGYAYDRESSELTMFHFKRLLKWLSSLPEVEGIHVVAHSRGTDVTMTTLRELAIEARARGERVQGRYKLRNVVLAAPDISGEVALQRQIDGGANFISDRWTTYTSSGDRAIGVAEFIFSGQRMGRFRIDDLGDEDREAAEKFAGFFSQADAHITYGGRFGGSFGHGYYQTDPVVSSDLVLAIRFGRDPGPEHGRPLTRLGSIFWAVDDEYFGNPPE